jgi:8-oxo-dGTP pyrophosphatase MutT (NUDIX family)
MANTKSPAPYLDKYPGKYRFISAVYLILVRKNELKPEVAQILLLKRFNTGYEDGNYSLIAGHLDGGETIKQAAVREAREEAGIVVSEPDLRVATCLHRHTKPERLDFFVVCEKWQGTVTNQEPDKCSELSWHDLDNLPTNIIPCVKQAIENYKAGVAFGGFGFDREAED